jgi:MFS family permease
VTAIELSLVAPWQLLCLALVPAEMLCAPAVSTATETLSQRVPAAARGEAMGLYSTALTLGLAVGGPVTGSIIDGWGTRWSFAITGLSGLLLIALATPLWRRAPQPTGPAAGTAAEATNSVV